MKLNWSLFHFELSDSAKTLKFKDPMLEDGTYWTLNLRSKLKSLFNTLRPVKTLGLVVDRASLIG